MFGKGRTKLPSSKTDDNKLPNSLEAAKAAIDNRLHDLQRRELKIRSYKTGSSNAERMQ